MRHLNLSNTDAAEALAPVAAIRLGLALAIAASLLAFVIRANSQDQVLGDNSAFANPPAVQTAAGN
jgi:hypothetical protein